MAFLSLFAGGAAAAGSAGSAATGAAAGAAAAGSAASTVATASTAATALKVAADIAMLGGAAISGLGSYRQGQAAENAAEYNAEITEQAGSAEARRRRNVARTQISQQRVNIGKSGVQIGGTPLGVMATSAANLELDALNAQYGASSTARLDRIGGRNARTAGQMGAASQLLTGVGGVASSRLRRVNL